MWVLGHWRMHHGDPKRGAPAATHTPAAPGLASAGESTQVQSTHVLLWPGPFPSPGREAGAGQGPLLVTVSVPEGCTEEEEEEGKEKEEKDEEEEVEHRAGLASCLGYS